MPEIKHVAVIGAGLMGRGIAHISALAGYQVWLVDTQTELLERAQQAIKKNLQTGVDKNKITAGQMEEAYALIKGTTKLEEAGKDADFVIEAVPEILELKVHIFSELDKICPEHTILATNTSAKSITEIASSTNRQDRVIGMHFFNPSHIMRLVEIIRGLEASDETCDVTREVAVIMGKEVVEVNESPGFVTTRINALIGNEAFYMLQEGVASARDIDKALKLGLNHPMGPFEMIDLVGLDTRLKNLEYLHETLGEKYRPCPLHVKYVNAGRLGRKVGKGVYEYTGD